MVNHLQGQRMSQVNVSPKSIKCYGVQYRQGWVEVVAGIHSGFVNLESWNVSPQVDITPQSASLASLPDEAITANTEMELSLEQAKQLVAALHAAIQVAELGA
jgi:hypothetical protein